MRQIGSLPDRQQAERFNDFLTASGISASVMDENGDWLIWVSDEDQIETARDALTEYQANPTDAKFKDAVGRAEQIRREQAQRAKQRNVVDVRREVFQQPTAKRVPLTFVLITVSIVVALLSNFGERTVNSPLRELMLSDRTHEKEPEFLANPDGLIDVKAGEVWRLITPIFVHFGIIHLAFNLLMLYPLAGLIETRRGTALLGGLVFVIALISNLAQFLISQSPYFGGMSGVLYGLLGFIWMRMLYHPSEGLRIHQQTIFILMVWLVMGFAGVIPNIANWCHLFGLLSGAVLGFAIPSGWSPSRSK